MNKTYTISGNVLDRYGQPISGCNVSLYQKYIRGEVLLGTTYSDSCGAYSIDYNINIDPSSCTSDGINVNNVYLVAYIKDKDPCEYYLYIKSNTIFNVSETETLDLIETGSTTELPKYQTITNKIQKVLGCLALDDLMVNNCENDITYLAGSLGVTDEEIWNIILSNELYKSVGLWAEVYYGLFEEGLISNTTYINDLNLNFQSLDYVVEEIKQLILNETSETITSLLNKAIDANIISKYTTAKISSITTFFSNLKTQQEKETYSSDSDLVKLLNLSNIPTNLQDTFINAYINNNDNATQTIAYLDENNPEFTDEMISNLTSVFKTYSLTSNHIPMTENLINEMNSNKVTTFGFRTANTNPKTLTDYTSFKEEDWKQKITSLIEEGKTGYPSTIVGDTEAEKIDNYATQLRNAFLNEYPNSSISQELKNIDQEISDFLENHKTDDNSEIDFINANIDEMTKDTREDTDNLKQWQRALRITPDPVASTVLYNKNLSSQNVYQMGEENFIEEMISNGVDENVAREAYNNATRIYSSVVSEFGRVNAFTNTLVPSAINPIIPSEDNYEQLLQSESLATLMGYDNMTNTQNLTRANIPDYETLFKSGSYCKCSHCKSSYGPASYLVDMLQFLTNRKMSKGKISKNAKDVLFERRGDIGKIDLECKNTDTAMPYIDLVCEILENKIAGNNVVYQTTKTEKELRANPEYVNDDAYKLLAKSSFLNTLPFNLYIEERRNYLKSININTYDLMDKFNDKSVDSNYYEAIEYFNLSPQEANFMFNPASYIYPYFGSLQLNKVKNVLQYNDISFEQLLDALTTKYITNREEIVINNLNQCNINLMTFNTSYHTIVYYLPNLIRICKATGWKIWEVDKLAQTPNIGINIKYKCFDLTKTAFYNIYKIKELQNMLNLTLEELLVFYNIFDDKEQYLEDGEEITNLYKKLFLNENILSGKKIDNAYENLTKTGGTIYISDHKDTILSALLISNNDLNLILDSLINTLEAGLEEMPLLNLTNLSLITRYTYLAKSLQITIKDLFTAINLIYKNKEYNIFDNPAKTYNFIEKYKDISKYKFDLRTLNYVLNYTTGEDSLISKDDIVRSYIYKLRNEFSKLVDSKTTTDLSNYKDIAIKLIATSLNLDDNIASYILQNMLYKGNVLIDYIVNEDTITKLTEKNNDNEYLYPLTYDNFKDIFDVYYLIHKMSILINKLKIDSNQLIWIEDRKDDLNLIDFQTMPINSEDSQIDFEKWLNLVKTFKLNQDYPKHDEVSIFDVLDNKDNIDVFNKKLSQLTYWDLNLIYELENINSNKSTNLSIIDTILKYEEQISMINDMGASVDDISNFIDSKVYETDLSKGKEISNSIKNLIKSKFTIDQWLDTSANVQDIIRGKKRDALLCYVINKVSPKTFTDADDVYEYLLIDPKMEACQKTTRILQANASIQLFVQRSLMNLEDYRVSEKDSNWNQWNKWMKNYRIWEANRKIFLYPENWIEPELRDDKTPFFKEFEQKLNQGEITNDYVEELYLEYLEKVNEVANLESVAIYEESKNNNSTVHVVAKTRQEPYIYYYRKQDISNNVGIWSPWEKLNIAPSGEGIILFTLNRRLYMMWLEIQEAIYKSDSKPVYSEDTKKLNPRKCWNLKLCWMTHRNGTWSSINKHNQDMPMTIYDILDSKDYSVVNLRNSVYSQNGATIEIYNNKVDLNGNRNYMYEIAFNGKVTNISRQTTTPFNGYIRGPKDWNKYQSTIKTYRDAVGQTERFAVDTFVLNAVNPKVIYDEITLAVGPNNIQRKDSNYILKYTPLNTNLYYNFVRKDSTNTESVVLNFDDNTSQWFISHKPCEMILNTNSNINPKGSLVYTDENRTYYLKADYKKYNINSLRYNRDYKQSYSGFLYDLDKVINNISIEPIRKYNEEDFLDFCKFVCTNTNYSYSLFITAYNIRKGILTLSRNSNKADILYQYSLTIIKNMPNKDYYYINMYPLYHPYISKFILNTDMYGIEGILNRDIQLSTSDFRFNSYYGASKYTTCVYGDPKYKDDSNREIVDFSAYGSYSMYNWEIFFHLPMLIANKLRQNQKFEDAQKWYHYIFNPMSISSESDVSRYWITKPFYRQSSLEYTNQEINKLMSNMLNSDNEDDVIVWRNNPFNPHLIARTRTVAYQKNVVMKYIDNLLDWADNLFRQNTRESINEASQLYVLSSKLLGKKPIELPELEHDALTYNDLQDNIDYFSNKSVENAVPYSSVLSSNVVLNMLPNLNSLYFCLSPNEELLAYWDVVADRLYKIRNCMNIEGIVQDLSLYGSPINPALLVKATAQGIDLNSILSDLSDSNIPYYRFKILTKKASELAFEVKLLGAKLLSALEKKDAEEFALLKSAHEMSILDKITEIKKQKISEEENNLSYLNECKNTYENQLESQISQIDTGMIDPESEQLRLLKGALGIKSTEAIVAAAGQLLLVPKFEVGTAGLGPLFGVETAVAEWLGSILNAIIQCLNATSDGLNISADSSAAIAAFKRAAEDWEDQKFALESSIKEVSHKINVAQIRVQIAKDDLKKHELEVDNAKTRNEYMTSKYTNKDLYNWMINSLSTLYFKSYKLAYDVAKKAQNSYKFELGKEASFIQFGYWDSLKKGLLAGESLYQDIKSMEVSYLDENKREYELTKEIDLDENALNNLITTGTCSIDINELDFDKDYCDQYFRRIKSVSLTIETGEGDIPKVIACTLILKNSKYRTNETLLSSKYTDQSTIGNPDSRFKIINPPFNSMATSSGIDDNGMFELNFNDDRYLPFEGAGAISSWSLNLNKAYFEIEQYAEYFSFINKVTIKLKYTSRQMTDQDIITAAISEVSEQIINGIG